MRELIAAGLSQTRACAALATSRSSLAYVPRARHDESLLAAIKGLIYRQRLKSRNAARLTIFDYIERFYNPLRRHSTLGQITPVEFELAAATATS